MLILSSNTMLLFRKQGDKPPFPSPSVHEAACRLTVRSILQTSNGMACVVIRRLWRVSRAGQTVPLLSQFHCGGGAEVSDLTTHEGGQVRDCSDDDWGGGGVGDDYDHDVGLDDHHHTFRDHGGL